jgi:uncharacterized repeat protein (TIGR01451 family)
VTITLPVTVVAGPGTNFVNTAAIDDGTGAMVFASVPVGTAEPDLDVSATQKVPSANSVVSGERVTYTITIRNDGTGPAPSARLTDTIQGGTYSGGAAARSGGLDDTNPPTITWNGALVAGDQVVITIPVTITASPGSDVPNVAEISDGYGTVFSRSTVVHVYTTPDISRSNKDVDQNAARVGETLVYSLTVVNVGEIETPFFVTDTLDLNTAFGGVLGTPSGSYGYAAGVLTWTGTVNGLSRVQLSFQATISPSASGAVTNTARFDDGAGGVYTDIATTLIVAPLLTATKRAEPGGTVFPGTLLTYTIVMSNSGGGVAQISLSDTIPVHTIFVGTSAQVDPPPPAHSPPQIVGSAVTWQDNLDPSAWVTVSFSVFIQPGAPSGAVIRNLAQLQELSEPGPLFSVTATNTVLAPVFSADKWSTPAGNVHPGEFITYSILLSNTDRGIARVVVTDPIPLHTTYVSRSARVDSRGLPLVFLRALGVLSPLSVGYTAPSYDPDNNWLTWQGGISPRDVVTLTFAVTVSKGVTLSTVITNVAWVDELSDPASAMDYRTRNIVAGYDIYMPVLVKNF